MASIELASDPLAKLILHDSADKPVRIAVLGRCDEALLEQLRGACSCTVFATVKACAAAPLVERQADLALLMMPASSLSIDTTLGLACRLFPQRLLVHIGKNSLQLPARRFFALGFRQLKLNVRREVDSDFSETLYEYRLSDYKQPPEWLNARFWANPERFAIDSEDGFSGVAENAGEHADWIGVDDDEEE